MSPEVNLDLEDVPFAILEVVKARILANRRRLGLNQEQTKPRPSTRPRAQFRKTGASSRGWRKPQHGAGVLGGTGFVLVPENNYNDGVLPVTADEFAPLEFSIHGATGYTQATMGGFDVVQGPAPGTLAIQTHPFNFSFGYLFTSNYATEPIDLKTVLQRQFGSYGFGLIEEGSSKPSNNLGYVEQPTSNPLENELARAKEFEAFTFEFLVRTGTQAVEVCMNNIRLYVDGQGEIVCRFGGVDSVSISEGEYFNGYYLLQITWPPQGAQTGVLLLDSELAIGAWHHFAVCKDQNELRFYIDGKQILSGVTASDYWDRYSLAFSSTFELRLYNVGNLPIMASVGSFPTGIAPYTAVHGLRFTPEALYTGATITPPAIITELA